MSCSSGSTPGELVNPCLHLSTRDSWLTEFPTSKGQIFNSPCTDYSTGGAQYISRQSISLTV